MCAAISLEWEQQPHYLEASLMMKGYSAAEARVAAERARSLPPAAARPPLLATAYATTRDKVRDTLSISLSHANTPWHGCRRLTQQA